MIYSYVLFSPAAVKTLLLLLLLLLLLVASYDA